VERIIVTRIAVGVYNMQACVVKDATDEEILEACNRLNPPGTSNGWTRIDREGNMAPVQCENNPDRLHVMLVC